MANRHTSTTDRDEPGIYQIRLKGHLRQPWADWFGDVTITLEENGDTLLTSSVVDQAALHGLLRKVRDLGVPLLAITRLNPGLSPSDGTTKS